MSIVEFLLARIAEDEAVAERAERMSVPSAHAMLYNGSGQHPVMEAPRLRADCEAKRRIVEAYVDAESAVQTYVHDHPTQAYWQEWGNRHATVLAVEILAAVYADHPDYDEAWRP